MQLERQSKKISNEKDPEKRLSKRVTTRRHRVIVFGN